MKKVIKIVIILAIIAAIGVFGLSVYVTHSTKSQIVTSYSSDSYEFSDEELSELEAIEPECILVLGCSVYSNGDPSPMLQDRLDTAIALYQAGVAPKLLLSGDNSIDEYNEPASMYEYAISKGVPEEDIFLDFAGFSTYESVYRAREVFCVTSMIIVTQEYHLYRSIGIANDLDVEALGVSADQEIYSGQAYREAREILARAKDFIKCIYKPESTFVGEQYPITGDSEPTHIY